MTTRITAVRTGGRFWGLFTPWHPDDLNARLKRNPLQWPAGGL
jgi:hypothetical protein